VMKEKDSLTYRGLEFLPSGVRWPLASDRVSRLSPDGNYLAVNSWDGTEGGGGDLPSFGSGGRTDGHYFVDVYNTNSGGFLFSVKGHFHNYTALPNDLFRMSAWISARYYVLPLDGYHLNDMLLCDVSKSAASSQEQKR
jgi:hypothetical protein